MKRTLDEILQEELGVQPWQIDRLVQRSPYTYKVYTIPKKSGGDRTIAQPARETKYLQNVLIEFFFKTLPVHDCAKAYKEGASIKLNAIAHKDSSYIVKYDFVDFFSSITIRDLLAHFTKYLSESLSAKDLKRIATVSSIKFDDRDIPCLSIGAPSSPILSNSILFDFDSQVHAWCSLNGISYTRYADDLTFSTNIKGVTVQIDQFVRKVINDLSYPRLSINDKKTTHLSKKFQRRITGVILNNDNEISLGRARKREISALIHKFTLNTLPQNEIFRLQGLLGFAKDVEPLFIARMNSKYGVTTLSTIYAIRAPKKEIAVLSKK